MFHLFAACQKDAVCASRIPTLTQSSAHRHQSSESRDVKGQSDCPVCVSKCLLVCTVRHGKLWRNTWRCCQPPNDISRYFKICYRKVHFSNLAELQNSSQLLTLSRRALQWDAMRLVNDGWDLQWRCEREPSCIYHFFRRCSKNGLPSTLTSVLFCLHVRHASQNMIWKKQTLFNDVCMPCHFYLCSEDVGFDGISWE